MARAGFSGLQVTEFPNSCNILCARETRSLTLRERHKKVSQNFARDLILYVAFTKIVITRCGPVQCLKNFCKMFFTDLKAQSVLKPLNDNL